MAMSDFSLILVVQKSKTVKNPYGMAKIAIKSEKLTPFGGIFSIMDRFETVVSPVIDSTLGLRSKAYGYQYSEIVRSLMCVCFCGGSCVEDLSSHLMPHLSLHPALKWTQLLQYDDISILIQWTNKHSHNYHGLLYMNLEIYSRIQRQVRICQT